MSVESPVPSGPAGFTAEVRQAGDLLPGAHLVACAGELDLSTSGQLEEAIASVADGDVVADLSDVSFMDSTGISILVASMQRLEGDGRGFVVVCPPGVPRRVLSLTGLEERLHTCDRLEEAAALLGR